MNSNSPDVENLIKSPLQRFIYSNFKNLKVYENYYKLVYPRATKINYDVLNVIKLDNEYAINFYFNKNIFGR